MEWRTPQGYFQLSEDGRYSVAAGKVFDRWSFQAWRTPRHEKGRELLNTCATSDEARKCAEADETLTDGESIGAGVNPEANDGP